MSQIDLDPESEAFIRREIDSGRYRDPADVIRAGLSRLEQDDRDSVVLSDLMAEAFADPRASVPADAIFERLSRKHAARTGR